MGLGVSLVVSVFNRVELFTRSYPTWVDKTQPDEIHVLNDGGDRALLGVVREMANKHPEIPFRYTCRNKGHDHWSNPGIPHNFLVKQARNPIVLIVDPEVAFVSDIIPPLQEFYKNLANRSSSCSACRIYSVQNNSRFVGYRAEQIVNVPDVTTDPANPNRKAIILRPKTPAKGCRAWWRQRYIALGGKDERYIGWGYEDLDLHFRQQRLPPKGKGECHGDMVIVEFQHEIPGMEDSVISQDLWHSEGEKYIPEDGVANREKEWGVLEVGEEKRWNS